MLTASTCTPRTRAPRGEKEQRIHAVAAWHETPFFADRERAALAWTEAVTLVRKSHVPDEVYELARRHFGEKELVDLTNGGGRDQRMEQTGGRVQDGAGLLQA